MLGSSAPLVSAVLVILGSLLLSSIWKRFRQQISNHSTTQTDNYTTETEDCDNLKNADIEQLKAAAQAKIDRGEFREGRDRIEQSDLVKIAKLGGGDFGFVNLVEHQATNDKYALKGLSKSYVQNTGMEMSVMNERNLLLFVRSDFIVRCYETYNSSDTLYFLLETALGGELYATYNRQRFHGSVPHCQFYSAAVALAFSDLHSESIIYRDLKPEHVLLTESGHAKLTDMGLAKMVVGKTYTTCGTPDYFAPEVIGQKGHGKAVDWWCLGVLIFELMSGHPPFESASPMQIYRKVMKGIDGVEFPVKCTGSVGKLIKSLLKQEPRERLPMLRGGLENLKKHKWYQGFDWPAMIHLALQPPHVPLIKLLSKSGDVTKSASTEEEDMPIVGSYSNDACSWDRDFATA